jgi:hypothetical protein
MGTAGLAHLGEENDDEERQHVGHGGAGPGGGIAIGWGLTSHWMTPPVQGADDKPVFGKVTVTDTEGHNLICVDNTTNTLYFYTIDKDAELGSDLKLRGSLDLNKVGADVLHPKVMFKTPPKPE